MHSADRLQVPYGILNIQNSIRNLIPYIFMERKVNNVSVKYPTPSKKQKAGLRSVRLKQKITKRNE